MPVKIRLQRHGRRGYPFYHIVTADSRAPRDGKFIERLGSYNPNTNPATIDLDFERALYWLNVGAQPTDTARNILSREGVLMKKHLDGGVKKGAFSQEEAEKRFQAWKENKEQTISSTKAALEAKKQAAADERLKVETEINQEKAKELAKKKSDELAAKEAEIVAEAEAEKAATTEEPVESEVTPEQPATDGDTPKADAEA